MTMDRARFAAYVEALHALVAGGVELVVIGSFAFALHLGDTLGRDPSDCDLVVRSPRDLDAADRALSARGWDVRVWEVPLARTADGALDHAAITGKTYARARRDALQIDLVYEPPGPLFEWERLAPARTVISGVPVAALEALLAMGEASAREKDRALAARVRALVAR